MSQCSKTGWRRDRIRQLMGMNTVNSSLVCKFFLAFPPKNICVSVKISVSSCRLSISLYRCIAQYHKRSSAVNVPAPHEYDPQEHSGSVVECLIQDQGAAGWSLTGITALWSLSKTHLSKFSTGSTQEDPSAFN